MIANSTLWIYDMEELATERVINLLDCETYVLRKK